MKNTDQTIIDNASSFLNRKCFWNVSSMAETKKEMISVFEHHFLSLNEDMVEEDFEEKMMLVITEWLQIQERNNISDGQFDLMVENILNEGLPLLGGILGAARALPGALRVVGPKLGQWAQKGKEFAKNIINKFRKPEVKQPTKSPEPVSPKITKPDIKKVGPQAPESPSVKVAPKGGGVVGPTIGGAVGGAVRSEEHTSELQSH